MERDILQVPLRPVVRTKLASLGFGKMGSFSPDSSELLSKELEIDEQEAKRLLDGVRQYLGACFSDFRKVMTASELLQQERRAKPISTGSRHLNAALAGGIHLGQITEFSGVPGVGKTQLCMQLCVEVQLPERLDGLDGSVVYIDTERGIVPDRLREIANAFVERCAGGGNDTLEINAEKILERIFYFYCQDYFDVAAAIHFLPELLDKNPAVKLIVLDSIAAHFRYSFDDFSRRAKILNGLMQKLASFAVNNNLAVVLTNQMTTRIAPGEETRLVPALGTSWGHACATRVNLFWKNECRTAFLFKSPCTPEAMVSYKITAAGVCDTAPPDMEFECGLDRSDQEEDADKKTSLIFQSSQLIAAEEEVDTEESEEFDPANIRITLD